MFQKFQGAVCHGKRFHYLGPPPFLLGNYVRNFPILPQFPSPLRFPEADCTCGKPIVITFPFGQGNLEDFMPEDHLQLFQVQRRSDSKHALPVEASVRYQNMAVGIDSPKVWMPPWLPASWE